MVLPLETAKRMPSQEHLLLDYVRRLEKHKDGRQAVHIHLSSLKPFNRRDHHIRAAANSFEFLVREMQGQLFVLQSSDLFFIYKDRAQPEVETVVQKVRYLFSDDPLLAEEESDDRGFATWYDVEADYDAILYSVQDQVEAGQRGHSAGRNRLSARASLKARQEQGEPLTPEVLERIESALERADLSNLVRRQFICGISQKMVPMPVLSEMFISIRDLRETLLPSVNLLSNRWLFQHLTETLDRRMLAMLNRPDALAISGDISINLNISTMLSPEFIAFDENLSAVRRGAIIIELQKVDIFADLGAYLFAREYAQDKGYRVCIDGLTHHTMPMVDRDRLGADLVKLIWDPEMADEGDAMHDRITALVARAGESRVVLCRVDTREAVDFGHSVGITLFQGRYIENLMAEDNRRRELLRLKRRIERNA